MVTSALKRHARNGWGDFAGGEFIIARLGQKKRSYRAERDFGLLVGGVLLATGGWWLYRGKYQTLAVALCGSGATLALLGAVCPKALIVPNRLWMGLAEAMGFVMTRVILALVFFLVVTPTGLLRKLFGGDPLNRRAARAESYWKPYSERRKDPRHYEKMY
ncbi:MAG: SxtJ family membrane protein [Pyrinomonadaceae bacterium]